MVVHLPHVGFPDVVICFLPFIASPALSSLWMAQFICVSNCVSTFPTFFDVASAFHCGVHSVSFCVIFWVIYADVLSSHICGMR